MLDLVHMQCSECWKPPAAGLVCQAASPQLGTLPKRYCSSHLSIKAQLRMVAAFVRKCPGGQLRQLAPFGATCFHTGNWFMFEVGALDKPPVLLGKGHIQMHLVSSHGLQVRQFVPILQ